jgi:hypothetical protein
LHIGGLPRLTLKALDCIITTKMNGITDLDISWCRYTTKKKKKKKEGKKKKLRMIYRWVEDDFLEKLIAKQKHLQRLTMWGTSRVTDVGVGACLRAKWDVVGKTSVIFSKD